MNFSIFQDNSSQKRLKGKVYSTLNPQSLDEATEMPQIQFMSLLRPNSKHFQSEQFK